MTLVYRHYIKLVAIRLDPFFSEIVDEQNFQPDDDVGIMRFKKEYAERNDCMVVEVGM